MSNILSLPGTSVEGHVVDELYVKFITSTGVDKNEYTIGNLKEIVIPNDIIGYVVCCKRGDISYNFRRIYYGEEVPIPEEKHVPKHFTKAVKTRCGQVILLRKGDKIVSIEE